MALRLRGTIAVPAITRRTAIQISAQQPPAERGYKPFDASAAAKLRMQKRPGLT
ncbi:MAG TPA: hypothetical protein VIW23_10020 [Candidatus Acidoferrum sp.]